jgi:hypothetical protein
MGEKEFKKQVSFYLPLSEWKAIRLEAAKKRISQTELVKRWIKRDIQRLMKASTNDNP